MVTMAVGYDDAVERADPGFKKLLAKVGSAIHEDPFAGAFRQDRCPETDRKSTRLNSSHPSISYAVFCLKKKTKPNNTAFRNPHYITAATVHRSLLSYIL